MTPLRRFAGLTALFLSLCAFSSQPLDERTAQAALPMSKDPVWKTLGATVIKVDEKKGLYSAVPPASVKALSGHMMTVTGFMLPLESTEKFTHFLLSKRTPTCPFCPPGEPNEVIDVHTAKPVAYTEDAVTVKGAFTLMNDREMGLFFKLSDAGTL
jgi:hypothetical protein